MTWVKQTASGFALPGTRLSGSHASRRAAGMLVLLSCLALPACKRAADAGKRDEPPPQAAQKSGAQARVEDRLVQQAVSRCQQRIQEAATAHAANAKRVQAAKVLDMKEVTQRDQVETKREVVRKFLASNEALKSLLVNEEEALTEELVKLNVPPARIASERRGFQSGIPGKAVTIRMREADQRIGSSLLGALDLLDEIWGQWNYNKEYEQVQSSPPGALQKYNEFMEAIEGASREQTELQEQLKAQP